MNFITDIYWNFQYALSRQIYKIGCSIRGDEYMTNSMILMQMNYHPCIGCKQILTKPNDWEYICCMPCMRKICKTHCVNCERKIWTNITLKPTHFEMDYCEHCIEDVSYEIKCELNHERVCIYNRKEKKFELYCKNNNN